MVFTVRAHEWYNFTFTLAPHLRAMLLVIRSRREHALKHVALACPPCHAHSCKGQINAS